MKLPLILNSNDLPSPLPPEIRPIDLRQPHAYAQGYIPGAINFDSGLLNHSIFPVSGLLPSEPIANGIALLLGLQPKDHILAYDEGGVTSAARLIWVLEAYGFHSVSWLNGGFPAWSEAGLPTENTTQKPPPFPMSLRCQGSNVITVEELMEQLDDPLLALLDTRTLNEFNGSDIHADRAGHIPNAIQFDWTHCLDDNHLMRDSTALQAQMDALGITKDKHVVLYCQTQQRSSVVYVMLKHLGYKHVRALDGGWSAWGNREDTPIVTSL